MDDATFVTHGGGTVTFVTKVHAIRDLERDQGKNRVLVAVSALLQAKQIIMAVFKHRKLQNTSMFFAMLRPSLFQLFDEC